MDWAKIQNLQLLEVAAGRRRYVRGWKTDQGAAVDMLDASALDELYEQGLIWLNWVGADTDGVPLHRVELTEAGTAVVKDW